jgi:hypothetical protein
MFFIFNSFRSSRCIVAEIITCGFFVTSYIHKHTRDALHLFLGLFLLVLLIFSVSWKTEGVTNQPPIYETYGIDDNTGDNKTPGLQKPDTTNPNNHWFPMHFDDNFKAGELKDENGTLYDKSEGVYFRDCKKMCNDVPNCEGIVTNYPVGFGPGGCYLKTNIEGGYPAQGSAAMFYRTDQDKKWFPMQNGVRSEELKDENGNVLSKSKSEKIYFRDCKKLCNDTPNCEAIVTSYPVGFGPGGCYLLRKAEGGTPAQGNGGFFYRIGRNVFNGVDTAEGSTQPN